MKYLFSLFLLLILFSCEKTPQNGGVSVDLSDCQEFTMGNDHLKLCYDSLMEDSRCPANANCVWQGVAKARFRFYINDQEHAFYLSTLNFSNQYRIDTLIGGYTLKLVNIYPYPGTTGQDRAEVEIIK